MPRTVTDLNNLPVFLTLVEAGSFTAAADRLGRTRASVSQQIRQLEQALGTSLFHRTTRRVTLTPAGDSLYQQAAPLLNDLQALLDQTEAQQHSLQGQLRITAPEDYAVSTLAPAIMEFSRLHPGLTIELRTGDRIEDLVKEGIDLAFRVGWLKDSSLRFTQLGTFQQHLVAAPEYLRRRGTPSHPDDLLQHDWIAFTPLTTPLTWTFSQGDRQHRVQLHARLKANATSALKALLKAGAGITVIAVDPAIEDDIQKGLLCRVLADWALPSGGIYAVYPPGQHRPARVRAFVEFLRERN